MLRFLTLALLFSLLSVLPVTAKNDCAPLARDMISKGDAAHSTGSDTLAADCYRRAVAADSTCPEAYWKLGRTLNDMGERTIPSLKSSFLDESIQVLARGLKVGDELSELHIQFARVLGLMELFKDNPWDNQNLVKRIKEELDNAIRLDGKSAEAYTLLGMWHRKVSVRTKLYRIPIGLGDASLEQSVEMLKKSVSLDPKYIRGRFELGESLMELNRKEEAKAEYKKVLDLPAVMKLDPIFKEKAQAKLKNL